MNKRTTAGNALFFILIAIFLLGGLTVLLSREGGQSNDTGDTEKKSLKASEIISYMAQVQQGVQKLMSRGCSESNLNFTNTVYYQPWGDLAEPAYNYPKSPADGSCSLFDVRGAGLTPKLFPPKEFAKEGYPAGFDTYGTMALEFVSMIVPGIGTDRSELMVQLGEIDMGICNEINRRNGIGLYDGDEPNYDLNPTSGYAPPGKEGDDVHYDGNVVAEVVGGGAAMREINSDMKGKKSFCVANTNASWAAKDHSQAYMVLIAR